jgi:hypothetical protein
VIRKRKAAQAEAQNAPQPRSSLVLGATSSLGGQVNTVEPGKEDWVQFGSRGARLSPRGETLPDFDKEEKAVDLGGQVEVLTQEKQAQLDHRVEGWLDRMQEPQTATTRLSIPPRPNNFRDSITPSESASMVGMRKGKRWFRR